MVKELHDRYLTGVTWSARDHLLAWAVVCAGAALRVRFYLLNHSISLDEAAVARNLVDRRWWQLLGPIDYAQVAPPGFLLLEKAVVSVFGSGEFALRAAPLIVATVTLLIAHRLVARIFGPSIGLCALALIALCPPFVEYAAIAKQYAFDIAASLAILWLTTIALDADSSPLRRKVAVGVIAVIPLFSFTSVFIIPAAAIAMWAERRRLPAGATFPSVLLVATATGVLVGRLSVSAGDREYLNWFWTDGFWPIPPHTARDWSWLWRQLAGVFGQTAHYRGATLWLVVSFAGIWWLRRRNRTDLAIACGLPLVLALIASAARLYPFGPGRVHLFLLPLLLVLVATGAEAVSRPAPRLTGWIAAAIVAITTLTAKPWSIDPQTSDVRAFEMEIANRRTADDLVYVYYWNAQAFLYYAPKFGLTESDYRVGRCSMGSGRAYLQELEELIGARRVWIAMPHSSNVERDTLLAFLDANGRRVETVNDFGYLYDLSPQAGRAVARAATFPLPPELSAPEPFHLTCYGVFVPVRR